MKHLALRLPNWLGDVIMTLPSLEALKTVGIRFELFGKPWIKDLFSAYDYPLHSLSTHFWQARKTYQKAELHECVLFTNSLSSALHLFGTSTKSIGYRSHGRQIFLNRSLKKPCGLHEIEYFWQLIQFAINRPLPLPNNPKLLIRDDYIQQANIVLKQFDVQDGFVVLCPGAIGHGIGKKSKIWPHWSMLANTLSQSGKQLVACPAPFETQRFTQIFGNVVTILPNLNIPTYAAIMQRAQQVVANDSGPMHLAAAVQTPVLGIFGQTNPQRCRPWGGTYIGSVNQWPSCNEVLTTLGF